jgi:hypothetical protein
MISWIIAATQDLSGATSSTYSSSALTSRADSTLINESNNIVSGIVSSFTSQSYSENKIISANKQGQSYYESVTNYYSSLYSATLRMSRTDYEDSSTTISTSDSFSDVSSFSSSSIFATSYVDSPSFAKQTSTATSTIAGFTRTGTRTSATSVFSTRSSSNTAISTTVPSFYQTSSTYSLNGPSATTTSVSKKVATALTDETVAHAGFFATVYEAEFNEILYLYQNPASSWGGYSAASLLAQSGTRFTVQPSYSLISIPGDTYATTFSSSTSNDQITGSINWRQVSYSLATVTSVVDIQEIPNVTTTEAIETVTTVNSSAEFTAAESSQVVYGAGESDVATTTNVTIVINSSSKVSRWLSGVVYDQIVDVPTTERRVAIVSFPLNTSSSTTYSEIGFMTSSYGDSRAVSIEGGIIVASPPQVGVAPGQAQYEEQQLNNARWFTSGARIGTQAGLFFTAATTLSLGDIYAQDGSKTNAITLFPQIRSNFTINSDSVTYTASIGTASTTSSLVVGVTGQPLLTYEQKEKNHGQVVRDGTLVVQLPAGAYRDRIAGGTTSFDGAAMTFASGQSIARRSWEPIYAATPPSDVGEYRAGIVWAVPRNSYNIP